MTKITLLVGYHKAEPIKPIDKFKSRFAYKLYVNNMPITGLWELDSVNVSKGTYTYKKRLKEVV